MDIHKLMLKDVRCFADENEFSLRPITFLVGENSTGKSTALGCLQVFCNYLHPKSGEIDFNQDPFQMGSFGDIVRKTRPLSKTFELGMSMTGVDYNLVLAERKDGSEPIICKSRTTFQDGEILIQARKGNNGDLDKHRDEGTHVTENKKNNFFISLDADTPSPGTVDMVSINHLLFLIRAGEAFSRISSEEQNLLRYITAKMSRVRSFGARFGAFEVDPFRTYSFAPIRSKPERTYDPVKEAGGPEGGEIPMLLMNWSMKNKREWEQLKQYLEEFGQSSGLFTDISVRNLGDSIGNPFQVQIKVRGPKVNLMDVGYGVSQILPIVVRLFIAKKTCFLLQQPEVHLHPKGQAALASLLVEAHKKRGNSFIIETHSDYMIDRVRIEIMKGKIKPEDVSLIYLEPVGSKVKVHNMTFDKEANIINPPQGYREFFLREQDRLLGFGE